MKIYKFEDPGSDKQHITAGALRKLKYLLRRHFGFKDNDSLLQYLYGHSHLFMFHEISKGEMWYDLGENNRLNAKLIVQTESDIYELFDGMAIFYEESIEDWNRSNPGYAERLRKQAQN